MNLYSFRRINRWWKLGAILALVPVAALGTLLILLETSSFQQWLLARISNFAGAAGIEFSARRLDLNLWNHEATLDGVVYNDRKGARITAERLSIDVPWNVLATDIYTINRLEIDKLAIEIGSSELIAPEPSGEAAKVPRVHFGRLIVRNGSLDYRNQNTRLQIPAFAIDVTGEQGVLQLAQAIVIPPDTQFDVREIPLRLTPDGLQFGPSQWAIQHGEYKGTGATQGSLQWAPAVDLNLTFATDPLTVQNWRDIRASGQIAVEDGVLKITDFRAATGDGQVAGSAEISDKSKSGNVIWNSVRLDPAGIPAVTEGSLAVRWTAADFSDASGKGSASVSSPQYGQATANILINGGKANLDISAKGFGAVAKVTVTTAADRNVAGAFRIDYNKYGRITMNGSLRGTLLDPRIDATVTAQGVNYQGIGPLNGQAKASLRNKIVSLTGIQAAVKSSHIDSGFITADLNSRQLRGDFPAIEIQLGDFVNDGNGGLSAAAQISGSIDRPAAALAGNSSGLDLGGTHIDSVAFNGRLADNVFELEQLLARQAQGELQAQGSVNFGTDQVNADVHIANLQLVQVRDLSTTVFLDGRVSGTTKAPATDFTGELRDVIYQGEQHGNVSLSGATSGTSTTIKASSDKYTADVVSSLVLAPPYPFDAAITANQTQIHYEHYDAVANGKLQASGRLQPFAVDHLAFDKFTLLGEGIDLTASGALPADAGADASTGVRVDLRANLAELPVPDTQLTGTAQAQAVVSGTLKDLQVDGGVRTTNATVRTASMTEPANIRANVDFTRDEFVIRDLDAEFADATAKIEGRGNLKGAGEFRFQADNIRPERLFTDRPISGLISLEGTASLTQPSIAGLTASARVKQLELFVREVEIRQPQPIEVAIANEVLEIRNFRLEGANVQANVRGGANLRTRDLNLDIDVDTDLQVLDAFMPGATAEGSLRTEIAVRGTPENPDLNGFLEVSQTQFELAEPPIVLSAFDARVQMNGNRMEILRAAGDLNGGRFTVSGTTGLSATGLDNAAIQVQIDAVQIEYPEGLQSEINSRLTLNGAGNSLVLTGNVDVVNALYSQPIDLSQEVNARLVNTSGTSIATVAPEQSSLLENINLDVDVRTVGLVSVSNNLANVDLSGAFRVRGNANQPIILGRAAVNEGGEIYFGPSVSGGVSTTGERRDRYFIDTGAVEFNNSLRTEPTFDFLATHELDVKDERYIITLRAYGTAANLRTELTSDPPLSEPDIIAMLLTGRTFTELQGAYVAVAREQFANYLSGQVSGFFDTAGSAIGLDTVRIEPVTLASEEDLSARLTIGKDITKDFNLAFSQNLKGTRSQTWIASYQTVKNLLVRGVNDSDKREVRFELRHDLQIGGGPPLPKRVEPVGELLVGKVVFSGTKAPEKDLLKRVTKPGKPFNAYRMNDDSRKLQEYFNKQDFLDVKIRARRNPRDGEIDVSFAIDEGPKIRFVYEGAKVPNKVQGDIREIWIRGLTEASSLRDATARLLRYFRDEGYLQASVDSRNASVDAAERRFAFVIEPGRKFRDPNWVFTGIEPIDIAESAGTTMENPDAIKRRIEFDLQKTGFLAASATVPELVLDPMRPYFKIEVKQGPQFVVSNLDFEGTRYFSRSHLQNVVVHGPSPEIPSDQGARPPEVDETLEPFPFTSEWVETARQRLTAEYWQQGFNDVQVGPSTGWDANTGKVTVRFAITEGERQTIEAIRIDGVSLTDMSYVTRQFVFEEGDPVDYSRINLTRKKLYDTRVFKRVEIDVIAGSTPNRYVANVHLNESAPWRIRYGFTVANRMQTSDRELGVATDLTYGNLFGKGITVGLSVKGQKKERDARVFGSFPVFMGRDVTTSVTLFRTRDLALEGITQDITGITLQQQWRLRDFYVLSYDYSFRRIHSFDPLADPDDPFGYNLSFRVGRFNTSLSRDSRDDILNATRGTFFSNSFEIAPPGFGTQFKFIKTYTQYFRFKQVMKDKVLATGLRLGLGRGFGGQDLIPSEQFLAGGGTTLRAFRQDELTLEPGNATLILNQEIRAPLFWRFGGVAFFDAGNVYTNINSFKPWKLRYSPGVGLRINTPLVLLRFDVGFNLGARTGEASHRFVFGIGQAF